MVRRLELTLGLWLWAAGVVCAGDAASFDATVAPVLLRACAGCHSGADPQGKLDLTTREGLVRGGESGPAWTPDDPSTSLVAARIQAGEMPPKEPLSDADRQTLLSWLANGAEWGTAPLDPYRFTTGDRAGYDWWSLQPLRQPLPPDVVDAWCRSPIDRFVLAGLHAAQLVPSPEATRRELIRRLSFDLWGLPPTPNEVAAFEADERPDAYERLVDRLLASPQYGVRWGRHWLDIVRFGESQGFERDKLRENAWPYRDWVIDALNADLPYDEFARLQLAGDVLPSADSRGVIATGFLVAGPWDEVGQNQQSAAMKAVVRQDELEDYVSLVGQTFLGLTVHCARCHDHKFDPIRQVEYYRLAAALDGVRHGSRDLFTRDEQAQREAIGKELEALQQQLSTLAEGECEPRRELQAQLDRLTQARDAIRPLSAYVAAPKPPPVSHVLLRGNPHAPAEEVTPGGLAAVSGSSADWGLPADAPDAARRIELAHWITADANPLFARVIVNRVWQYHFSTGLVSTPSDFGFSGGRPSHPELLDWLAIEFRRQGQSLKGMHRLIVTSAAYRQSSRYRPEAAGQDAENRLLWRMAPRRLEGETLRDALLLVAGELNDELGGPGYRDFETFVRNSQFYEITDPAGAAFQRRTVYRTWIRSGRSPLLDVFDCPDPSTKTPARAVTVTPLQALSLLNNSFVLRMSERLAARVERQTGAAPHQRPAMTYRLAYCRAPTTQEASAAAEFIAAHGLAEFCRVLLNGSEFIYVD